MNTIKQIELQNNCWTDERGWGVNPLQALNITGGIPGNLHIVSLKPGAVRGNHYHSNATEWILVFGGNVSIVWRSGQTNAVTQISAGKSKPALFEIPADIEHAVYNDSGDIVYLAVFYDALQPDTAHCTPLVNR